MAVLGSVSVSIPHSKRCLHDPTFDNPSVSPSLSLSANVWMGSTILSPVLPHAAPLHTVFCYSSGSVASSSDPQLPPSFDNCKRFHLKSTFRATHMNASVIRPGDCVLSPRVSTALPLLVPSRGLLRQQRHRVAVLQQIRQRLHSVRASSLKDSEPEVLRQVDEHPPHIEVERLQPVRGGEQQERDGSEILTEEGKGDILDQANDGVSELPTTRDRIDEGVALRENVEEDLSVAVQGTVVATVSLLGVLGVFGAVGIFFKDQINDILSQFADLIEAYGPAGYVIFVLTYAGLEVLALPAIPLTMSAGFLFGPLYGTILVSIAGTLAATGAFLIARYLARDRVLKLAQGNKKFLAIDKAIGEDGFWVVTLLRLSPLLPFSLGNYLYGLTSVKLLPYVLGSCLGMLPGTWAYVSAGALGRAFIRQESEELFPGGPGQLWTLGIGLVATVLAASYVTRIAKDAVKDLE